LYTHPPNACGFQTTGTYMVVTYVVVGAQSTTHPHDDKQLQTPRRPCPPLLLPASIGLTSRLHGQSSSSFPILLTVVVVPSHHATQETASIQCSKKIRTIGAIDECVEVPKTREAQACRVRSKSQHLSHLRTFVRPSEIFALRKCADIINTMNCTRNAAPRTLVCKLHQCSG
jgi:hypothetical protein